MWADDVHELLELAKTLAVPARRAPGRANGGRSAGLAIMTCSGGDSAQGADEAERLRVALPALAPATREQLRELLPVGGDRREPARLHRDDLGRHDGAGGLVQTLGADPSIGRVLVFYDQPPNLDGAIKESWDAVREGIIAGAALSEAETIVSSTLPELLDDEAAWGFIQDGHPRGRRPAHGLAVRGRARAARQAIRTGCGRSRGWRGPWRPRRMPAMASGCPSTTPRSCSVARASPSSRVASYPTRTMPWRARGARRAHRAEAERARDPAQVGRRRDRARAAFGGPGAERVRAGWPRSAAKRPRPCSPSGWPRPGSS